MGDSLDVEDLRRELAALVAADEAAGRWVRRTWKERLLTLPWRPWTAEKWVQPFNPRRWTLILQIYYVPGIVRQFNDDYPLLKYVRQQESPGA